VQQFRSASDRTVWASRQKFIAKILLKSLGRREIRAGRVPLWDFKALMRGETP
jgi:hypothetical protein